MRQRPGDTEGYCANCQWGRCRVCERYDRNEDHCCCGKPRRSGGATAWELVSTLALGIAEASTSGLRIPMPDRLAELRAMPYREYLLSPEWKARRKERIALAGERCQECGFNPRRQFGGLPFNLHHLTYERRGMESWDDLILLCSPCHRKAHGKDKILAEEAI